MLGSTWIGVLIEVFSTLLGSVAAFSLKLSTLITQLSNTRTPFLKHIHEFSNHTGKILAKRIFFLLGVIIYVVSAYFNMLALKFAEMSVIYPTTSLTWIWTLILAKVLLKEKISSYKLLGMLYIILGVFVIAH